MNHYERIQYDPASGELRWAKSARGIRKGAVAGFVNAEGYRIIKLGRRAMAAHRLAWFLAHGVWPKFIDHINGHRDDNRLVNLRSVDHGVNMQNKRSAMRNNVSCGLLGVTWNKQHRRWQSKIMVDKVFHHVGYFKDPESAHAAYVAKKRQLHFGCTI